MRKLRGSPLRRNGEERRFAGVCPDSFWLQIINRKRVKMSAPAGLGLTTLRLIGARALALAKLIRALLRRSPLGETVTVLSPRSSTRLSSGRVQLMSARTPVQTSTATGA